MQSVVNIINQLRCRMFGFGCLASLYIPEYLAVELSSELTFAHLFHHVFHFVVKYLEMGKFAIYERLNGTVTLPGAAFNSM